VELVCADQQDFVAFAADRLLLATDGTPAARDLWEQKWQTADIDNAQMAA